MTAQTIPELLAFREESAAPFLIDALTGKTRSFAVACARARRWGWFFLAGQARRVAVVLPSSPDFAELYLGAGLAGVTVCPLNPALTATELAALCTRLGADMIMTTARAAPLLAGPAPVHAVGPRGSLPADLPAEGPEVAPVAPDTQLASILTSGTTGGIKACRITHRSVCWTSARTAEIFGLGPGTRYLTPLPLHHINAQVVGLLAALQAGSAVILGPRLPAARLWAVAEHTGATALSLVPAIVHDLLGEAGQAPASLRFAVCSSAPLAPGVRRRFEDRFGVPLRVSYGLTEAGCFVSYGRPGGPPDNVGVPVGCEVRVSDGEILVRGPGVFAGYEGDDAASRAALRDGWLHTGDRGRLEGDFLILDGRIKEMINRGGEKIAPPAVEAVLAECPGVREVAVFGLPDPRMGEEVAAAVVGDVADDDLWEFCQDRLAEFETPRTWLHVDALPRGSTGKVLRGALQEEARRRCAMK